METKEGFRGITFKNNFKKTMESIITQHNVRWLTLKGARKYCSIGERKLIQLAKKGFIRGGQLKDNGNHPWFFDALSIDRYMDSMLNCLELEDKAEKILKQI